MLHEPIKEKVVTLQGVTWEQFKAIEAPLSRNQGVRSAYLEGVLEITSPISREREYIKSTLSLLLEAYMRVKGTRFYGRGGFTLEKQGYASGTPDESYCIGTDKETPDIVIEVIVSSGSINRKELHKPTRVPEVWYVASKELRILRLENEEYEEVDRSSFFSDLDKTLLLKYIDYPDQYDAVNDFTQAVRNG